MKKQSYLSSCHLKEQSPKMSFKKNFLDSVSAKHEVFNFLFTTTLPQNVAIVALT